MSTLDHVTDAAVWGSLISQFAQCSFMAVQAVGDPARRGRYGFFAAVTAMGVVVDFLHGTYQAATYEALRLGVATFFGASVVSLHGHSRRAIAASLLVPAICGYAVWFRNPDLAMNVAAPITLGIAVLTHLHFYWLRGGYASIVLGAHTTAMVMAGGTYYLAMATGDQRVIATGYAHWAFLNLLAVFFGWIHLPRELRGLTPVRVSRPQAAVVFVATVLFEAVAIAGLLKWFSWPPTVTIIGLCGVTAATALLFFHHRHRLVIHTDNVTALLHQNESQAEKLKEMERELQARAAVIERQRRLELAAQTAGQAAHDIQNALSPIVEALGALGSVVEPGTSAEKATAVIRGRVENLLELNGQLLTLSHRGRMDAQPIRLRELIDETRSRFVHTSAIAVTHGEDVWVSGSFAQLNRAISNLLFNALEAAGPSGAVTLGSGVIVVTEARRCHLGFLSPGRYAMVEIGDDGPGIPADLLDRIFEPYYSSKKRSERSGLGLGLCIVAAVAEDHRGVVDVQSAPGQTRFTLYVPAIDAPGTDTIQSLSRGEGTVLLVDDDRAMREWYARTLQDHGYAVRTAAGGPEALHLLQAGAVDLMVLDLKLPVMSGLDVYIGALHVRRGLPVVVHSSFLDESDASRLRQLGIQEMLAKPASRRDLLLAVRRALARQRVVVE